MNPKGKLIRIGITPGEPAGIGPDICLHLAHQGFENVELILFADPNLMEERAKNAGIKLALSRWDPSFQSHASSSSLVIEPISLAEPCIPGQLNKANAKYVIETINKAVEACQQKKIDALVTGPVQKSIIQEAGYLFPGHTEWLAKLTATAKVVMMLAAPSLKVALATTHIPLAQVSSTITSLHLEETLLILNNDLKYRFGIKQPHIMVCGLNPHAGENGHIGREEIEIISPTLEKLRKKNFNLTGPLSADTLFLPHHLDKADAILAMYHDQGLPVLKTLGFGKAVNITLGLPIIRTSVDHGTALSMAGTLEANPDSLIAAIQMAISMIKTSASQFYKHSTS